MKKTVVSVLMILALSLAFVGCGNPEPDPFPSDFPKPLVKQLEKMGVKSFIAPEDVKFESWEFENDDLHIAWSKGSEAKLNKYEQALKKEAKAKSSIPDVSLLDEDKIKDVSAYFKSLDIAFIYFIEEVFELDGKTVPKNSILFSAAEKSLL